MSLSLQCPQGTRFAPRETRNVQSGVASMLRGGQIG
jgi:hypothetical protein